MITFLIEWIIWLKCNTSSSSREIRGTERWTGVFLPVQVRRIILAPWWSNSRVLWKKWAGDPSGDWTSGLLFGVDKPLKVHPVIDWPAPLSFKACAKPRWVEKVETDESGRLQGSMDWTELIDGSRLGKSMDEVIYVLWILIERGATSSVFCRIYRSPKIRGILRRCDSGHVVRMKHRWICKRIDRRGRFETFAR